MISGTCPGCTRSYTVSEVTGFGILRARPASKGGPLVEFSCPGCARTMRLIPHGEGRYALPGEPPPEAAPPEARRPPWVRSGDAEQKPNESEAPAAEAVSEETPPQPEPAAPPTDGPDPIEIPVVPDTAPTVQEAMEILGITPTTEGEAIDRAFRERSRTCHPDKVAHLDPDFQTLAEAKFKRLQAAYTLLRS